MDDPPSPRASADKLNALGAPGDGARAGHTPHPAGAEIHDYQGGRNRRVQVTRRGWNRFDAAKKKIFLKWFAATANAKDSARRAGVGYSTVYDHRMADARFSEAWDRALEQSYARLEAKVVQMQFEEAAGGELAFDGSFEPPDPPIVDLGMAMQLLKQHKADVTRIRAERSSDARSSRRGKQAPTYERGRTASDAEMRRALVKSLSAFGARVTKEDLNGDVAGPSTTRSSASGPPSPPLRGREE